MSKHRWSETKKKRRNVGSEGSSWEDFAHKYTPNPFPELLEVKNLGRNEQRTGKSSYTWYIFQAIFVVLC